MGVEKELGVQAQIQRDKNGNGELFAWSEPMDSRVRSGVEGGRRGPRFGPWKPRLKCLA